MSLLVTHGQRHDCNVIVYGKHYDGAASRLLDVSADNWEILSNHEPDRVRILGPTISEIASGMPQPTQWQIREVRVTVADDGAWSFDDASAKHLLTIDGVIEDELYGMTQVVAHVAGCREAREVPLAEQISRRQLLIGDQAER